MPKQRTTLFLSSQKIWCSTDEEYTAEEIHKWTLSDIKRAKKSDGFFKFGKFYVAANHIQYFVVEDEPNE